MSAIVKKFSDTLRNKGGYTLKDKVRVFVDKPFLKIFQKSKKFKIDDAKAIDEYVKKNGRVVGFDFYSNKGTLTYWCGWDNNPNKFYIDGMQEGCRYYPNEANLRGVMVLEI